MTEPVLATFDLGKTFGGLTAVAGVSIDIARGELHALIGPNGAGKSTLLNLLSGETLPSAGAVRFNGRDITALKPHQTARLGLGRSFQRTTVLPALTCLENCWLGAQAHSGGLLGGGFRFFRPASRDRRVTNLAHAALERLGLAEHAATPAHALSHGAQRQLEIAMILAAGPELLLLDEPLAGLGAEQSAQMAALIRTLAGEHTIVLVEHDMDAVFAIAERITVLVEGQVLETGTPAAIQDSRRVQDAYLGHGDGA